MRSQNRRSLYTQPLQRIGDFLSYVPMGFLFTVDRFSVPDPNLLAFARAMKWATSISLGQTKEQALEV